MFRSALSQGSGFRFSGSGFRVQSSGFRVQGSGSKVQGSGFRVQVQKWGRADLGMSVDENREIRVVELPDSQIVTGLPRS